MRSGAVVIENDLFGIVARLKSIDDGYFVVYDKRNRCFEVHNSFQRGDTFALKVPYPCLDVRTERLVRRTRAENAAKLVEEMEKDNARLEKQRADAAVRNAALAAEEAYRRNR